MQATALKVLGFIALMAGTGAALATDSTPPDPVAAWEADKATIFDADAVDLDMFKWRARPVIVFAESENDPAFARQLELLAARKDELVERDVVLIVDTSPDERSAIRTTASVAAASGSNSSFAWKRKSRSMRSGSSEKAISGSSGVRSTWATRSAAPP